MELLREVGSWGSYWRIVKKSIYLRRKSRGGKRAELGEGGAVMTHWGCMKQQGDRSRQATGKLAVFWE